MPDRDYYLSTDPKLAETRTKYLAASDQHADARGRAERSRAGEGDPRFRNEIAKVHWTRAESRDANKTYNKMSLAEVRKLAPGFDFPALVKARRRERRQCHRRPAERVQGHLLR